MISLIVATASAILLMMTESKKDNRKSVGIRAFIIVFFVTFVALTYLINDGFSSQEIDTGEPNF